MAQIAFGVTIVDPGAIGEPDPGDPESLSGMYDGGALRAYIDALEGTDKTGRQSTLPLKVPGVAISPAGFTFTPANGSTVLVDKVDIGTGFTGNLENWDFRDMRFNVLSGFNMAGKVRNCRLGGDANAAAHYPVNVEVGASCEFEYCTFDNSQTGAAAGSVINSGSGGTFAEPTFGEIRAIRYCRFTDWRSDTIKVHGATAGQSIEYNYFGMPHAGPLWTAEATFDTAERCVHEGRQFESKGDGNTGNTPPSSSVSDDYWTWKDVHGDVLTVVMAPGGTTVRRNLFHFGDSPDGPSPNVVGGNNAIRGERNTNTNYLTEDILVEENVIWSSCPAPIGGGLSGGENHYGPVRVINNAIQAGTGGVYIAGTIYDEISGNFDVETEDAIVPDLILRNTITALYGERLTDTSARCYAAIPSVYGSLYWVFTSSATAPSLAQIKAGQDHTGSAALASGDFALPTVGAVSDVQTWDATGLPSEGKPYLHAAYERLTYSDIASAGFIDLAATDYAARDETQAVSYAGPRAATMHSLTVAMQLKIPSPDAASDETLFTLHHDGFRLLVDPRNSATAGRSFSLRTTDSTAGAGTLLAASTPRHTFQYGIPYLLVATATQNQDSGGRAVKLFLNGVEVASATGAASGTGLFPDSSGYFQKLFGSIYGTGTFPLAVRSVQVWHGEWCPTGDTSGLGTPDADFDGAAAFWNGAEPVTDWDLTGAGQWLSPVNTILPAITGTATSGQTLTCSTGTWAGVGTISYAYQWVRGVSNIGSATASTYTLTDSDKGQGVACRVTATDDNGSGAVLATARGVKV